MAWNGTVTCSECWQTGHNKNGCPRRKERYEEALVMPEEERGFRERRIIEEWENKRKRNTTRKCTYCDEIGHNRRSCEDLKSHMAYVQKQNVAFKEALLEHLRDIGLNTGAFVQHLPTDRVGFTDPIVLFVQKICWDQVHISQAVNSIPRFVKCFPVRNMGDLQGREMLSVRSLEHWPTGAKWPNEPDTRYNEWHYSLKVVAPTSIAVEPPEGWLTETASTKAFFKDRNSWMWANPENEDYQPSSYYSCEFWKVEEEQQLKQSA